MKKIFALKCTKCNEEFEVYCTYEELAGIIKESKCPFCHAPLRRDLQFGYGKLKGSGFTRKGGLI